MRSGRRWPRLQLQARRPQRPAEMTVVVVAPGVADRSCRNCFVVDVDGGYCLNRIGGCYRVVAATAVAAAVVVCYGPWFGTSWPVIGCRRRNRLWTSTGPVVHARVEDPSEPFSRGVLLHTTARTGTHALT